MKKTPLVIYYTFIGLFSIYLIWFQDFSGAAFGGLFVLVLLLSIVPIFKKLKLKNTRKNT